MSGRNIAILTIALALLMIIPAVSAASFSTEVYLATQANVGNDGHCGRSSENGGSLRDCNTAVFTGTGPGACGTEERFDISGCYFWQPRTDGPAVNATSLLNAPFKSQGTLHVWTGSYGQGTFLREQVHVYVNGKKVGTTQDPWCNENENCHIIGPRKDEFPITLEKGINHITFTAVKNGGSVTVHKYRANMNEVVTPSPALAISVDDVWIKENSGLHKGIVDLLEETTSQNINRQNLIYELVSESNPEIVDCFLTKDETGKRNQLTCETQQNKHGSSTLKVRVTGGGLTAEDIFKVNVHPLARCDATVNPQTVVEGNTITLHAGTRYARSAEYSCGSALQGSVSGLTFQQDALTANFLPGQSGTCTVTVYTQPDFTGSSSSCTAGYTVVSNETEPTLALAIDDVSIRENSGTNRRIVDLLAETDTNLAREELYYTIIDQSAANIAQCFVDSFTYITCIALPGKQGVNTVTVKVTGRGLTDIDSFDVNVIPREQENQLDLALDDVSIRENSGTNRRIVDLLEGTDTNIPANELYYSITDQSAANIAQCFVDSFTYITCIALPGKQGVNTVTVKVVGRGLTAVDSFNVNVIPREQEAALDLAVPDREVQEDSGRHEDFINLHIYTDYTGNFDDLTYTLLDQTDPEIIECELDGHYIDCTTKDNQVGTTTLTVRVGDGTLEDIDSFDVTVTPENDIPSATFIEGSICQGHATTLSVNARDVDGDVQEVKWDFGDGSGPAFGASVQHVFTRRGTFTVKVTITGDAPGDITTLQEEVTVQNCDVVTHKVSIQTAYFDNGLAGQYDVYRAGDIVDLYVKVKNLGNQNEDVRIIATLPELGLEERIPAVTIKEGEGKWRIISFALPHDLEPGVHVVRLTADSRDAQETRYVAFTVE